MPEVASPNRRIRLRTAAAMLAAGLAVGGVGAMAIDASAAAAATMPVTSVCSSSTSCIAILPSGVPDVVGPATSALNKACSAVAPDGEVLGGTTGGGVEIIACTTLPDGSQGVLVYQGEDSGYINWQSYTDTSGCQAYDVGTGFVAITGPKGEGPGGSVAVNYGCSLLYPI